MAYLAKVIQMRYDNGRSHENMVRTGASSVSSSSPFNPRSWSKVEDRVRQDYQGEEAYTSSSHQTGYIQHPQIGAK